MIIYGIKAVLVKSVVSKTSVCPSCSKQGSLKFSVYRKHTHIFWIPLFPIGKKGVSQCEHCKHTMEVKEMPKKIQDEYESIKSKTKGPLWQFIGLVMIIGLIVFINYINMKERKLDEGYIRAPMIGDIYKYKIDKKRFSTLKVIEISSDSIIVSKNEYEVNKKAGISKIDNDENYSRLTHGISKEKLNKMFSSREIYDVKRSLN